MAAIDGTPTSLTVDIKYHTGTRVHTSPSKQQVAVVETPFSSLANKEQEEAYTSALACYISWTVHSSHANILASFPTRAEVQQNDTMSRFRIQHKRTTSLPISDPLPTQGFTTPGGTEPRSILRPASVSTTAGMSGTESDMDDDMTRQRGQPVKRSLTLTSTEEEPAIIEAEDDSVIIDVAELLHSPSLNRRSISVFQFDEISSPTPSTPHCTTSKSDYCLSSSSTPMSSFSTKRQSTSSTESLREDRRTLVLGELLQTERRYISSLEIILSVFLTNVETVIAPRDLRLMFPCQLEPMIVMHRDLLARLEERVDGVSRWHGIVGDVFGRICSDKEGEFVALYSAYMNEFKIAMKTLAHYESTSPLFCKIISDCSQQSECEGLSLAAFLLTPIQRIPRYELLLKTLLKHTSGDHPDCYYIEAALNTIHSNLVLLDRSMQACELASTVRQEKEDKKSNKRSKRRKRTNSSRFAEKIRRHFSQTNISDLVSPQGSPRLQDKEPFKRPSSVLEKTSHLARSVSNLLEQKDDDDKNEREGFLNRAISFSDVLLLNSDDTVHEKPSDSISFQTDPPVIISRSPSINSHESIETGPPLILNTQRASIYSSNSSTSGFDSLGGDCSYNLDETGTLKPHPITSTSHNSDTLKPHPQPLSSMDSTDSGYREPEQNKGDSNEGQPLEISSAKLKKKTSISTAFKVLRRASKEIGNSPLTHHKRSSSLGNLTKVAISQPMDFRHIEHGFKRTSTVL